MSHGEGRRLPEQEAGNWVWGVDNRGRERQGPLSGTPLPCPQACFPGQRHGGPTQPPCAPPGNLGPISLQQAPQPPSFQCSEQKYKEDSCPLPNTVATVSRTEAGQRLGDALMEFGQLKAASTFPMDVELVAEAGLERGCLGSKLRLPLTAFWGTGWSKGYESSFFLEEEALHG